VTGRALRSANFPAKRRAYAPLLQTRFRSGRTKSACNIRINREITDGRSSPARESTAARIGFIINRENGIGELLFAGGPIGKDFRS